jgi:hypothetical protein
MGAEDDRAARLAAARGWARGERYDQDRFGLDTFHPGCLAALPHLEFLLAEADRLAADLAECRRVCAGLAERVAAQAEVLARRAERAAYQAAFARE